MARHTRSTRLAKSCKISTSKSTSNVHSQPRAAVKSVNSTKAAKANPVAAKVTTTEVLQHLHHHQQGQGANSNANAKLGTAKQRALWAMYSGPFKLTPAYTANPVHAFPFEGRGLMTQKMDGMYMLYDGKGQMYNRGRGSAGAQISAQNPPHSYTKHLPPVELEGELCYSSGEYSRGHSAKKNDWRDACLFVWDAPRHPGTYAERWQYLTALLANYNPKHVRCVPFLGVATSRRVLDKTLNLVRNTVIKPVFGKQGNIGAHYDGGEGVMVRDPDAAYAYSCAVPKAKGHKKGQTTALYKWLEEYGNDECRVIGPAQHAGHANSLHVELPSGTRFFLTSLSRLGAKRAISPGTIITFTYHGWEGGRPVNASAQAVRTDRTWEDIQAVFIPPPNLRQELSTLELPPTHTPPTHTLPSTHATHAKCPRLPDPASATAA